MASLANAQLPYCRGCGHALVVRQLSRALERLALPPRSVVLTTDIGCVGLADALFPYLDTVHTTHGRSTAMATGMALADAVLPAGGLKPVVMIGDGGAMIGLLHLVHAAQLNVDVTVLVHNNFLFGMTGGQHSAFTPLDWITSTTPEGNWIPPIDLLALLRTAHAGFLARQFATDRDLDAVIADAISFPGFAVVEVLETCTGYGLKNKETSVRDVAVRQGHVLGRIQTEEGRPAFRTLYRRKEQSPPAQEEKIPSLPVAATLRQPIHLVIAGTAGERVQSSAALLCRAALSADLYSTQKNDNPVTQGSGFSLSEICIAPRPIGYTGMESIDALIVVSKEGWQEIQTNGTLAKITPETILILDTEIENVPQTGRLHAQPFRREATPQRAALAALAYWLGIVPSVPSEAWEAAIDSLPITRREDPLTALQVGKNLASKGGKFVF